MKHDKEFDLLVFIGRFQPFHVEHKRVVDIANLKARKVLILIGSAGKARSSRNPWTYEERKKMIRDTMLVPDVNRTDFAPLPDSSYDDDEWIKRVQKIVNDYVQSHCGPNKGWWNDENNVKIGLIGASKDHTSYYLNLFPQWGSVDAGYRTMMHATAIREQFFECDVDKHLMYANVLPPTVCNYLFDEFKGSPEFEAIKAEAEYHRNYKKSWESAPYPPIHHTVDAVVIQSGHVLLVKRRASPGKGLWALPGGFVNAGKERLLDAMIRELREETKIKVPEAVLRGSIRGSENFDDPHRSERGHVISTAYAIRLKDGPLPPVKGSDDAEKAKWVPIATLEEDKFFEDHFHIINKMMKM